MGIALVLLFVLQAGVSSSVATVGVEYAKLKSEIDVYKKENAILQEKLLSAASFTVIAEKAEKDGFIPTPEQMTLTPLPLAHR